MKNNWTVIRLSKSGDARWRGQIGKDLIKARLTWQGRTINVFFGPGRALRIGSVVPLEMSVIPCTQSDFV
jgi:hypothetical protein